MNTKATLPLLLFLASFACYAHDHSMSLTQGQGLIGFTVYTSASNKVDQYFSSSNGSSIDKMVVNVGSGEYRTAWAGESLSYEYALYDGFSLGLKTNAIQSIIGKARDDYWNIQGAIFSSLDLSRLIPKSLSPEWFRLFWNEEVQLAPIYTTAPSFGDGLLNIFSTISGNIRIINTKPFVLSAYLDFKTIVTTLHPYYTFNWMRPATYLDYLGQLGLPTSAELTPVFVPTTKFVMALGLDAVAFEHLQLYVGLNYPLGTILTDTANAQTLIQDRYAMEDIIRLNRWEFELKYKL